MKLSIAALAAVGVSACHWSDKHEHNMKVAVTDLIYKPLFGESVKKTCAVEPVTYKDGTFMRKLMGEAHKASLVAAFSDLEESPVGDECFGDWMHQAWGPIHSVGKKMHDDFWSVTYEEYQAAGTALLDIHFKNAEACQFQYTGDSMVNWCLNNEGACWGHEGWFKNVAYNAVPIVENTWDFILTMKENDLCYSDDELIANMSKMYADWISSFVMSRNLQVEWYTNEDIKHVKLSDYKKEKKAYKHAAHKAFWAEAIPWIINKAESFLQ